MTILGKIKTKLYLHRIWWQLAVLSVICAGAVYAGSKFADKISNYLPESGSFPSTYNTKPSGYSGLYELSQRVGLPAKRWCAPYRQLKDHGGVLVIVQPQRSLKEFEIEQILSWVATGNRLLILDYFQLPEARSLLKKLHLQAVEAEAAQNQWTPLEGRDDQLYHHVEGVSFTTSAYLNTLNGKGGTPLISLKHGILLTQINHGKGQIVIGTAPSFCANRQLGDRKSWDNFQLVINWLAAGSSPVFFDEFCHGFSLSTSVFIFLARQPVGLVIIQLLVIAAVAVAASAWRFGAVCPVEPQRRISNLEFVTGMASTYRRAKANKLTWEILSHAFISRLAKILGVPPASTPATFSKAWATTSASSGQELEAFLTRSRGVLAYRRLDDAELISLVAACDKIQEQSSWLLPRGKARR